MNPKIQRTLYLIKYQLFILTTPDFIRAVVNKHIKQMRQRNQLELPWRKYINKVFIRFSRCQADGPKPFVPLG